MKCPSILCSAWNGTSALQVNCKLPSPICQWSAQGIAGCRSTRRTQQQPTWIGNGLASLATDAALSPIRTSPKTFLKKVSSTANRFAEPSHSAPGSCGRSTTSSDNSPAAARLTTKKFTAQSSKKRGNYCAFKAQNRQLPVVRDSP